jgi:hypothetical protein
MEAGVRKRKISGLKAGVSETEDLTAESWIERG